MRIDSRFVLMDGEKILNGESKQIPLRIKYLFRHPKFEDLIEIQTKCNQNPRFSPFTLISEFDKVKRGISGWFSERDKLYKVIITISLLNYCIFFIIICVP